MPKWKVELGANRSTVVEADAIGDTEAWVDFLRGGTAKQGGTGRTTLVRRFRRQDVHEITLEED